MKGPVITKRDAMAIKKKHCVCVSKQDGFTIGNQYLMKIIHEPETYIVLTDDNGKERRFKNIYNLFSMGCSPRSLKSGETTPFSLA